MTESGSSEIAGEVVAAFDVDAQYCFTPLCPRELPVPGGDEIVAELNAQASLAHYRIGSKDAHSPNAVWVAEEDKPQLSPLQGHVNADTHWNLHAVPGTQGFELLDGLPRVIDYDYFVWKGVEPDMHPYGACYHDLAEKRSTGVIEFLQSRAINTVIVGGLALDVCVKATAMQLIKAGFRVLVNLAASRGLSAQTEKMAIIEMKAAGIEFVDSSARLTGVLNAGLMVREA